MNSFHNTVKYLRLINIKSALNTIKECNVPRKIDVSKAITFSPRSIGVAIRDDRVVNRIKQDPVPYIPIINPRSILPILEDQWKKNEIDLPAIERQEKQAVRLIVIRRKKMKKHQKKKLYKKMKFRWARIKQNRRQMKEKNFQNSLIAMVKEANEFSAEAYVTGKIEKANHTPIPKHWRLPDFIMRQLLGIDKKINYKHNDVYKA